MLNSLHNPSTEYSPLPFWFFNDVYSHEKTVKQLTDFVEKGVNGFVLHPRIGLPKEMGYLSKEYFDAVKDIVKIASGLKMTVILYDEGMYPSGSVCGQVVAENPAYRAKGIRLLSKEEKESFKSTEEGLFLIEDRRCKEIALRVFETIYVAPDGSSLVYMESGGNIRGIHFGEDDGEEFAPPAADILDADAVKCFIRLTHDRYYENLKEYFGNTIIAMFTDEPSPVGRNSRARAWYKGLEKDLAVAGGDVSELVALFNKPVITNEKEYAKHSMESKLKVQKSIEIYHKLIKARLNKVFYGPISDWCKAHEIGLCGHPESSDDVREEFPFEIPGQDLIMRRVCPENGGMQGIDSVQAKLCADIAYLTGKRRNLNECFGVCSLPEDKYNLPEDDMVWMINWMGFRGTNLYVPHAFYYTYADKQRDERPPDVGPNSKFWGEYKKYSDYFKRISYLNTDSKIDTKIAVLCDNNRVPAGEIKELYDRQISFVYLPIELMEVVDDKVVVRKKSDTDYTKYLREDYAETEAGTVVAEFSVLLDPLCILESEAYAGLVKELRNKAPEVVKNFSGITSDKPEHIGIRLVRRIKNNQSFAILSNEGNEKYSFEAGELRLMLRDADKSIDSKKVSMAYNLFTMEACAVEELTAVAPRQMFVIM